MKYKKKAVSFIIASTILIAVQALLMAYFYKTDSMYLPSISSLGISFILPVVLYYIGYLMIGIIGLSIMVSGVFMLANPGSASKFFAGNKFQASTSVLLPISFGLMIYAFWQNGVLLKILNTSEVFLPKPSRFIKTMFEMIPSSDWSTAGDYTTSPDMADHIVSTLRISLLGLIIGSILGYGVAVIATVFKKWGKGGLTVVSVFTAIPIVALAPVMMYWTKVIGIPSDNGIRSMVFKIMVVMLICTSTMSINAYRGLNEFKTFSDDLLKTYAANKREMFLKLRLPNSVPYIFTALKVGLPQAIISALVSEYFGDADVALGIGRMIKENITNSQFSVAWVYISIACCMGILLYAVLMILQGVMLKNRGNTVR